MYPPVVPADIGMEGIRRAIISVEELDTISLNPLQEATMGYEGKGTCVTSLAPVSSGVCVCVQVCPACCLYAQLATAKCYVTTVTSGFLFRSRMRVILLQRCA